MAEIDYSLALVTGAARRLGRAFALSLAEHGYAILLHFHRSGEAAVKTRGELRSLGVPVFLFEADLRKPKDIDALFSYLDTLPYRLKVLVNSAAEMQKGDLRTLSVEQWDAALELNLRAPWLLAQGAAARMQQGGLIVNVSDVGAGKTWSGYPAYSVSKAGLESLTRLLAKALSPGVRVNAIAPGLVMPHEGMSPQEWEKLVGRLPLKRPTSPAELTAALAYLLANEAVTGQTITVDGGYSLL